MAFSNFPARKVPGEKQADAEIERIYALSRTLLSSDSLASLRLARESAEGACLMVIDKAFSADATKRALRARLVRGRLLRLMAEAEASLASMGYSEERMAALASMDEAKRAPFLDLADGVIADQILAQREILSGKTFGIAQKHIELFVRELLSFQGPRIGCELSKEFLGVAMKETAKVRSLDGPQDVSASMVESYLDAMGFAAFGGSPKAKFRQTARAKRVMMRYLKG